MWRCRQKENQKTSQSYATRSYTKLRYLFFVVCLATAFDKLGQGLIFPPQNSSLLFFTVSSFKRMFGVDCILLFCSPSFGWVLYRWFGSVFSRRWQDMSLTKSPFQYQRRVKYFTHSPSFEFYCSFCSSRNFTDFNVYFSIKPGSTLSVNKGKSYQVMGKGLKYFC